MTCSVCGKDIMVSRLGIHQKSYACANFDAIKNGTKTRTKPNVILNTQRYYSNNRKTILDKKYGVDRKQKKVKSSDD